ncbi:MAG TPA: methyltransferase domain-containing protein [Planctomycetes bacterium]|nr:methyltransferase domain-containing protein [Planctomycetota bacterium]
MLASDYQELRRIIYDRSGITLGDNKQQMLSCRLARRLRELGFSSEREYIQFLVSSEGEQEVEAMLEAVTTNVTSFFRESAHFDHLREQLESITGKGRNRVRIWCAAASTGQEPYTLAIVIDELMRALNRKLDARILSTDLSTEVLAQAYEATYQEKDLAPIPQQIRARQFEPVVSNGEKLFRVVERTRSLVTLARLNLAKPPFPMKGPFDAVFCRNVMIYFDDAVRGRLLEEIHRLLGSDGLLYVGHSEGLTGWDHKFERLAPSVYRKIT